MVKQRKNLILKGKFAGSLHPAKLLFGLLKAKKSGTLTLEEGTAHISLYLVNGCVVFDRRGVFVDEDFGQFIIARNLTTEQEYRQYRSTARKKKTTPVEMMIQAGILDNTETELLAQEYFWRAAPSFFMWRKGEYTFVERRRPDANEYATPANGAVFILRGILDKYDPKMMRERVQKRLKNRLKINENNIIVPADLAEMPVAAKFLDSISEDTTLSDLMDGFDEDVDKTIALAYGLLTLGVLKFSVSNEKQYERALRRRTDPLSRLFTAAVKSVDQVHARTDQPKPAPDEIHTGMTTEIGDAKDILAALEKGEDVQGALSQRLNKLLEVKRAKREMLQQKIHENGDGVKASGSVGESPEVTKPAVPIPSATPRDAVSKPDVKKVDVRPRVEPAPVKAPQAKPAPPKEDLTADFNFADGPEYSPVEKETEEKKDTELPEESNFFLGDIKDEKAAPVEEDDDDDETVIFDFGEDDNQNAEEFMETVDSSDQYNPDIYKPPEEPKDDITSVAFTPDQSFEVVATSLRRFVEQEKWKDADRAFTELQMRGRDTADILALGGWARYHIPCDDPFAQGAMLIQKGIDMDPKQDMPYLYMGRLYMEEGDHSMAELYFIRALEVNKDCFEAKEFMKKLYEL